MNAIIRMHLCGDLDKVEIAADREDDGGASLFLSTGDLRVAFSDDAVSVARLLIRALEALHGAVGGAHLGDGRAGSELGARLLELTHRLGEYLFADADVDLLRSDLDTLSDAQECIATLTSELAEARAEVERLRALVVDEHAHGRARAGLFGSCPCDDCTAAFAPAQESAGGTA